MKAPSERRSEQRISLLNFAMDRVRDAAFLIDEKGRCHYTNESACHILGYNAAEVLGMDVWDIDPDSWWKNHACTMANRN